MLNLDCLLTVYQKLRAMGITLEHINIGGGLGITYHKEHPPKILDYAKAMLEKIAAYPLEIVLEPGRAIVGNAGVLLTRVEYLKHNSHKNFAIVDAGMNDLLRPALYHAWQEIMPVTLRDTNKKRYDIAGPVCESSDIIGKEREIAIMPGDILSINSAGAYGFSMSSNYNSRCRPPEILIDGNKATLIRRRETIGELYASETLIDTMRVD
jgi:diaminopimelate decarboxylase